MDSATIVAFEERAVQAEARLAAIEARLAAGVGSGDAELVQSLEELKQTLLRSKTEQDALKKERDEAVAAKASLEKELSKAQYRILHLTRTVRELDGTTAK